MKRFEQGILIFILVLLFLTITSFIYFSPLKLLPLLFSLVIFFVTFRRVRWGAYLMVFFLPLLPRISFLGTANYSLAELLVLVVLFGWILDLLLRDKDKLKLDLIGKVLLLFLLLSFLITLPSIFNFVIGDDISTSMSSLYPFKILLNLGEVVLLYLFVINSVKKEDISKIGIVLLSSFSLVMVYGIIEKLFLLSGSIVSLERIQATFHHPNIYAVGLLLISPLLLWSFLHTQNRWVKLFFVAGIVLLIFSIILTYSRMAWILFFIIFIIFLYYVMGHSHRKNNLVYLIGILISIAVIGSVVFFIQSSNESSYHSFSEEHRNEWEWFFREPCDKDPVSECSFRIDDNSLQFIINPKSNGSKRRYLGEVRLRQKVDRPVDGNTTISWEQDDKSTAGSIRLHILTSEGYRWLIYSACNRKNWKMKGWVNLTGDFGCGVTIHDRNIVEDYLSEYETGKLLGINFLEIGHLYYDHHTKDSGIIVYNLILEDLPLSKFSSKEYISAKSEYNLFYRRLILKDTENNRVKIYARSFSMALESPLGIGVGGFRSEYNRLFGEDVHHSHNLYLQMLVERGIIGFILFILLIMIIFNVGYRLYVFGMDRSLVGGLFGGIVALLLYGFTDYPFYDQRIQLLFWMFVGMLMTVSEEKASPKFKPIYLWLGGKVRSVWKAFLTFFSNKNNIFKTLLVFLVLVGVFFVVYFPHLFYPFPYHIDEWRHITQSNLLMEGNLDQGLGVFELGFDVFLAFIARAGIDLIQDYQFLPAFFASLSALLLFFLVLRVTKKFYAAIISMVFFSLLSSNVNILGIWFLTPLSFSLPFLFGYFILFLSFIEHKDKKSLLWSLLGFFILLIAYPISGIFGLSVSILYGLLYHKTFLRFKRIIIFFFIIPFLLFLFFVLLVSKVRLTSTFVSLIQRVVFEQGFGVIEISFSLLALIGGIQLIFFLFSIPFILSKRKSFFLFIILGALLFMITFWLFGFTLFIPYQRALYYFMIGFVPLSGVGFYHILRYTKNKIILLVPYGKIVLSRVIVVGIFLSVIYFLLLSHYTLDEDVRLYQVIDEQDYITLQFLSGVDSGRVLAPVQVGVALNAVSGHEPIASLYFYNIDKRRDVERFYGLDCGKMRTFIKKEKVDLIVSPTDIGCGFREIYRNVKNRVYEP